MVDAGSDLPLPAMRGDEGLKGAAIATSISCGVGGLMVLGYLLLGARTLRLYRLKWSVKSLRLSLRNVGYMARIGLATFIAEVAMGVMMVSGNYMFMSYLGEAGVAAFSIGYWRRIYYFEPEPLR